MLWLAFMFASSCGLMVIGSLKDFGVREGGLSEAEAEGALGLLAVFNAAGRIAWGWVSQRLGPRRTLVMISLLQALMVLAAGGTWLAGLDARTGRLLGGVPFRRQSRPVSTADGRILRHEKPGGELWAGVYRLRSRRRAGTDAGRSVWDLLHSYRWAFCFRGSGLPAGHAAGHGGPPAEDYFRQVLTIKNHGDRTQHPAADRQLQGLASQAISARN